MPAGRPPKFATPDDLQDAIEQYFRANQHVTDSGEVVRKYTMSGLANALGMSRQTLCNYSHKDEFVDAIKDARSRVEECLEVALYGTGVTGIIFNLKNNFQWKDKTEQEHSGNLQVTAIERTIVDPKDPDS